jgi:hypothetical protein
MLKSIVLLLRNHKRPRIFRTHSPLHEGVQIMGLGSTVQSFEDNSRHIFHLQFVPPHRTARSTVKRVADV